MTLSWSLFLIALVQMLFEINILPNLGFARFFSSDVFVLLIGEKQAFIQEINPVQLFSAIPKEVRSYVSGTRYNEVKTKGRLAEPNGGNHLSLALVRGSRCKPDPIFSLVYFEAECDWLSNR